MQFICLGEGVGSNSSGAPQLPRKGFRLFISCSAAAQIARNAAHRHISGATIVYGCKQLVRHIIRDLQRGLSKLSARLALSNMFAILPLHRQPRSQDGYLLWQHAPSALILADSAQCYAQARRNIVSNAIM